MLFWGFGVLLLAGVAYLIRDWRYLNLTLALPTVLFLSYHWYSAVFVLLFHLIRQCRFPRSLFEQSNNQEKKIKKYVTWSHKLKLIFMETVNTITINIYTVLRGGQCILCLLKAAMVIVFLCLWRIPWFPWPNCHRLFLYVGWCQNPLGGWPSVAEETKRRKSWDTPQKSTTGSARIRSWCWRIRTRVWAGCHYWRFAPLLCWWSGVSSSVWTGELYF